MSLPPAGAAAPAARERRLRVADRLESRVRFDERDRPAGTSVRRSPCANHVHGSDGRAHARGVEVVDRLDLDAVVDAGVTDDGRRA